MIEPFSKDIRYSCKLKRHHKLIFAMWYNYKTHSEIAKALTDRGCPANRKTVWWYINRCLEEEGLPHDYSMPMPKGFEKYACSKYHDEIFYMRNYLGYSGIEIAAELGLKCKTVLEYVKKVRRINNK